MAFSKWEKVGAALLVFGAAMADRACGQAVVVDSAVAIPLQRLAQDSVEHVACIYGRAVPDTFYLTSFTLPIQKPLGTHNVAADTNDCWSALAHWHNHPVPKDSVAASYLYYSLTDEHTFTKTENAPLAVVAVPGVWCIWTHRQVQEGYDMNLTPLPGKPQQCIALP